MSVIFSEEDESKVDPKLRQLAGLGLKSFIDSGYIRIPVEILDSCVKVNVWNAFLSSYETIVKTASIVISTIVLRGGLGAWPEIIDLLTAELKSDNVMRTEHASYAVSLIIEDSSSVFEGTKYDDTLKTLLETLGFLLSNSQSEIILANVIQTINTLIVTSNSVIHEQTENYLDLILQIGKSEKVYYKILQGICTILDFQPQLIFD
jgi:hypothetical protein